MTRTLMVSGPPLPFDALLRTPYWNRYVTGAGAGSLAPGEIARAEGFGARQALPAAGSRC